MAAPIARASPIPATIMNRSRPRGSTTTSTRTNITWYRFQADTGLQAAYTDPINPLFDAVSPQPLYSFAAGYTHIFSSQTGELFQSGVLLVRESLRTERSSEDLVGLPDRAAGHRRERALYDHRRSGQYLGAGTARPPASSSMTTWRGPLARMSFGLEPTPESSG